MLRPEQCCEGALRKTVGVLEQLVEHVVKRGSPHASVVVRDPGGAKAAVLRMVAGLLKPDTGSISVFLVY